MRTRGALLAIGGILGWWGPPLLAQDKVTQTPSLIQVGFGPGGFDLLGDGSAYCGATTATMSLAYLASAGFTQILPSSPDFADYLQLEQNLVGLSGSTQLSGATGDQIMMGVQTYLAAKGFATAEVGQQAGPDLAWFTSTIPDPYQATFLVIGWYTETAPSSHVFTRGGGHFIAVTDTNLSGPGQPAPGYLVLSNPAPGTLFSVPDVPSSNPQYAQITQFTGTISGSDPAQVSIQFDPAQPNSTLTATNRALIENGFTIRIHPDELPTGGWTPATWVLTGSTPVLNTGGGDLEVLAPLAGEYGLHKTGGGTLFLTGGTNATTGTNTLNGGGISTSQNQGTPLGTGSARLDYGTLTLAPEVTDSPADIALTLASGTGSRLTFAGGATLALAPNGNSSLTVTVGDSTATAAENFQQQGAGTLVIAAATGNASLGSTVKVLVSGSGTVPLNNGMVSPAIVAADNNAAADGDFLTYTAGTGFSVAGYTSSGTVGINAASASAIYNALDNQVLTAGSTAAVHAVRVQQSSLTSGGGTTTLQVGGGLAGDNAGVILNGGQIGASVVDFGASRGVIYSSNEGGQISSSIQTTGGVSVFGPGNLTLTGTSSYTGGTFVQSGTLTVANSASATGSGPVEVGPGAALVVSGSQAGISGEVTLNSGTLVLEGGTVGAVTTSPYSLLEGYGTISGIAEINGSVGSGATIGTLVFTDAATFAGNSVYEWTLGDLTTAESGGVAGEDWSLIDFQTTENVLLGPDSANLFTIDPDFSLVDDPNSGNPFWNTDHTWVVMRSERSFYASGNALNLYFGFATFEQGQFFWNTSEDGKEILLYYDAVPEPATGGLVMLAALLFVGCHRRQVRTPGGSENL